MNNAAVIPAVKLVVKSVTYGSTACLHWIRKWLAAGTFKFIYPLVLHGSPMLAIASVKKIGKYMGISRSEPLLILNGRIASLTDRGSQTATGHLSPDLEMS
jgi:hypothetical protein